MRPQLPISPPSTPVSHVNIHRLFPRCLRVALLLMTTAPAWALDVVPYDAAAFAKAQSRGQVNAIQFHSGWCPICVMQERGIAALKEDRALDKVVVFQADFLKEEEIRRRFSVTSFSTLVIFRGTQERARTTGDFQAAKLRDLFGKAL